MRKTLLFPIFLGLVWAVACSGGGAAPGTSDAAPGDQTDSGERRDAVTDALGTDDADLSDTGDGVVGVDADGFDSLDQETASCEPDCAGLECGPDGCGGVCGACPDANEACVLGRCECRPSCTVDGCGVDGCGGYCDPCLEGLAYRYDDAGEPIEAVTEVYCDETTRTCVPPVEECTDGWCRVPAGSFLMGQDGSHDPGLYTFMYAGPVHPVVLTRPFLIQQTEVTIAQYQDVMEVSTLPGRYSACGPDCPVVTVTPFDAMRFANRLGAREARPPCYVLEGCADPAPDYGLECARAIFEGPDCAGYRLPSEAEWEHAARAGSRFCAANGRTDVLPQDCAAYPTFDAIAWYCPDAAVDYEGCVDLTDHGRWPERPTCAGPHPVAQKRANRFGLHDTSGNVHEITGTLFGDYDAAPGIDPGFDPVLDAPIVSRGGFFGSDVISVCSSTRSGLALTERGARAGLSGFRLVRTLSNADRVR